MLAVADLDEFRVRLAREGRMRLKRSAELVNRECLCILDEDDAVRVAHRDAGHLVVLALDLDVLLDDAVHAEPRDGNLLTLEHRLAHVDAHARDLARLNLQARHENARARLDRELLFLSQAEVVEIAREAADAVATHLRLTAVRIEDAHAEVRLVRRQHVEHAVTADAVVAVADLLRKRGEVAYVFLEAVD